MSLFQSLRTILGLKLDVCFVLTYTLFPYDT